MNNLATHVDTFINLCTVDDVSAQTSCIISPDFDDLTIADGLQRDVEFHCQCIDSNGMMITGTRWLLANGNAAHTQNLNIPPVVLYIAMPFDNPDTLVHIFVHLTIWLMIHLEIQLLLVQLQEVSIY